MRSHQAEGFTFDRYGSHIIFSKNRLAIEFMVNLLGKNRVRKRRNTKILYGNRYIKYPFENGLSDLAKQDNFDCLNEFIENKLKFPSKFPAANLKEWCYRTFGRGISEKYLIPYNEKIWKCSSDKLGVDWVNRIPSPPMEDIIKSSIGIKTEGYTHQLYFYYPKLGGIQAVTDLLLSAVRDNVVSNFVVNRVKKEESHWIVSDGRREKQFANLVSTIPLHELVKALDAPREINDAVNDLKYNSIACVMLGLKEPKINRLSWLYLPDKAVLSHRVSFPSNYGLCNAPKNESSVLAEITYNQGDRVSKMKDPEIISRVISDLDGLNILNAKDVCYSHVERAKYAYVINDLMYQRNLQVVTDYVKNQGIQLLGRFAEFKYLNMDACVERSMNYVQNLKLKSSDLSKT